MMMSRTRVTMVMSMPLRYEHLIRSMTGPPYGMGNGYRRGFVAAAGLTSLIDAVGIETKQTITH